MPNSNRVGSVVVPYPVWARHCEVKRLTGAPDKWLTAFGKLHPEHTRKFGGGGQNGTLVYNVAAVLSAVAELGEVRHV